MENLFLIADKVVFMMALISLALYMFLANFLRKFSKKKKKLGELGDFLSTYICNYKEHIKPKKFDLIISIYNVFKVFSILTLILFILMFISSIMTEPMIYRK